MALTEWIKCLLVGSPHASRAMALCLMDVFNLKEIQELSNELYVNTLFMAGCLPVFRKRRAEDKKQNSDHLSINQIYVPCCPAAIPSTSKFREFVRIWTKQLLCRPHSDLVSTHVRSHRQKI
jgi:hypothetical protein